MAGHNKADSFVDINSLNEKGYETKYVTKDSSGKRFIHVSVKVNEKGRPDRGDIHYTGKRFH